MAFEIDFLAVGEGEKSGDAIAIRYGDLSSRSMKQTVVLIDGGNREAGQELVKHVQTHYGTSVVDLAILTHPDNDHASGLREVIENLCVGAILMHRPWLHAAYIRNLFQDGRVTVNGIKNRLYDGLEAAVEIEELASKKNVKLIEPFQGMAFSHAGAQFDVLSPERDDYRKLLVGFRSTPGPAATPFLGRIASGVKEALEWVREAFDRETLDDAGETSAENNSSAIVLVRIDGKAFLFTGDAGIEALTSALLFAGSTNIDLSGLEILQVPHHGSKRNIGPTILNSIGARYAFISAAKQGAPKHPSRRVTNALLRRNIAPYVTQGKSLRHASADAPARQGWSPAQKVDFVEWFQD